MGKLKFSEWLVEVDLSTLETEMVDSKQIEGLYAKAKHAIELVRKYDAAEGEHNWIKKRLGWQGPRNDFGYLLNISTIAPLAGTVYGLFNSRENQRILDKDVKKYPSTFKTNRPLTPEEKGQEDVLKTIAYNVMKKQYPDIDTNKIHDSAVIHVNIPHIINTMKSKGYTGEELDKAIIREIASTIVHESTHQLERAWMGATDEGGPKEAEKRFVNWLDRNMNLLNMAAK